ncbi:MAG: SAM-dependent methyltransferase, partial [Chloroflexota bacterium]|nr:SAM-dependent methyltransferase [Chloroflexota bacterium]
SRPIHVDTIFPTFATLWLALARGQGTASDYLKALTTRQRRALQAELRAILPIQYDDSIRLRARAWAVRGVRPVA